MTTPDAPRPRRRRFVRGLRYLHPFVFALAPLLTLFAVNQGEVPPAALARPSLALLCLTAALLPVFYLLARRHAGRAALGLSGALLAFFTFDQVAQLGPWLRSDVLLLLALVGISPVRAEPYALALLWALAVVGAAWVGLRTRRDYTAAAWLAAAVLAVPPAFQGARSVLRQTSGKPLPVGLAASPPSPAPAAAAPAPGAAQAASSDAPDLYVIVLDAYGREDVLRTEYGYDNRPFLAALEARGFTVAPRSHANYVQTVLALASALNLEYLPNNPEAHLAEVAERIDGNAVASLLRSRGYKFVNVASDFPLTTAESADVVLDADAESWVKVEAARSYQPSAVSRAFAAPFPTPFEVLLLDKTSLVLLPHRDDRMYERHRQNVLGGLEYLKGTAEADYPKFVLAHVLLPHPPFVFDADGGPVNPDRPFTLGDASDYKGGEAAYRLGYVAQLQFANTRILDAVDAIRSRSRRPAAIVLMGDHGPRSRTDWQSRERTDVYEAFNTFLAVSCPPGPDTPARQALQTALRKDITPINALRLVLNDAFGTAYPPLENRSFYSGTNFPLAFQEVTAEWDAKPRPPSAPRRK